MQFKENNHAEQWGQFEGYFPISLRLFLHLKEWEKGKRIKIKHKKVKMEHMLEDYNRRDKIRFY